MPRRPRLVFNAETLICWTPQPGATAYQLAQSDNRQFTTDCITTDVVGNCHEVSDPPVPALYYLVRATAPNTGSWGRTSAGQERVVACP